MRLFAIKTEPDPVSFGEQTTLRLRVVFQNREWRAIENMVLRGNAAISAGALETELSTRISLEI